LHLHNPWQEKLLDYGHDPVKQAVINEWEFLLGLEVLIIFYFPGPSDK
jgi:hypothetical protein